jgi:signal recognition particle GTPase
MLTMCTLFLEKQFEEMVKTMLESPVWSFRPWKKVMEEQLSSWVMYIPGMSSSKEAKEMKGMKGYLVCVLYSRFYDQFFLIEMLDVMTPEELDNPDKINGKAQERISRESGKPIDDVRMLLFIHKQSQVIHQWIQAK